MVNQNVIKFEDIEFQTTPEYYWFSEDKPGAIARVKFDNGYELSVVTHNTSYGGSQGLYEIMLFNSTGDAVIRPPITDDDDPIRGWCTPEMVSGALIHTAGLGDE